MNPGDKVTYVSVGKKEHGIVKSISDAKHVFVVYHCNDDWENYWSYTAARTCIDDLKMGWRWNEGDKVKVIKDIDNLIKKDSIGIIQSTFNDLCYISFKNIYSNMMIYYKELILIKGIYKDDRSTRIKQWIENL